MKSVRLLGGILLLSVQMATWAATPASPPEPPLWSDNQPTLVSKSSEEARKRWEQMSPQEREDIRASRKQYESLPPSERQKIREVHERYQRLSPEERRELQEKWRQQRSGSEQPQDRRTRGRD